MGNVGAVYSVGTWDCVGWAVKEDGAEELVGNPEGAGECLMMGDDLDLRVVVDLDRLYVQD